MSAIKRVSQFYRQHGFIGTVRRFGTAFRRLAYAGKNIVFVCELPATIKAEKISEGTLERKTAETELTPADVERIISPADSAASRRRMTERFAAQAELWLIRCQGVVAAFGWTIKGRTMEPHFVKVSANDWHLFDFFVFPEFRGRGLNPALVVQILQTLSHDNRGRAFIEAAAWNTPQLASLKKTPFRKLGAARKLQLGKTTKVFWSQREPGFAV